MLNGRFLRVIEEPQGRQFAWLFNDFETLDSAMDAALTFYRNATYCGEPVKPVYVVDINEKRGWRLLGGAWIDWTLPLQRTVTSPERHQS